MLESLVNRLQEGDYIAHVERTVVENDGEDGLLADRYRARHLRRQGAPGLERGHCAS